MNKITKEYEFKVGDKVKYYKKDEIHNALPDVGAIGVIDHFYREDKRIVFVDFSESNWSCWDDSVWPVDIECLQLANNEKSAVSNEEIWTMLEPKMKKIGLVSRCARININNASKLTELTDLYWQIPQYDEADVQRAIIAAYRSGYGRAMKGRPFMIGEK